MRRSGDTRRAAEHRAAAADYARRVHGQAARQGTPFLGRRRELAALRGDIERAGLDTLAGRPAPRSRVLLIAGKPGSGRSALAQELAREVAADYPDGTLHASLSSTAQTARDLLDALGVRTLPGAGEEELLEVLGEALAVRRTMLILDDVTDPEPLEALIPDSRDCLVLLVAEGPLKGVPDVRPCTLGGLEPEAAAQLLAHLAGETRVACDPKAAQALAEECGGYPAALLLAGGWLAARPEASVADALGRLREQQGQGPEARPLARTFRLVHDGLPAPAAQLLRLLALAPTGLVDAQIASALAGCTVSAATKVLDDLARQGVLRKEAQELYRLPGALQPLLQGLLQSHERPAEVLLARARMLERGVRLLQSCRAVTEPADAPVHKRLAALPRSQRFASAAVASEWLHGSLPALLAAARMAVADGELDTLARRYVAALSHALAAHQAGEEAAPEQYRLHQLVLEVAERRELHPSMAAALLNLGDLDSTSGRPEDALIRYRAALVAARAAGDPLPLGRALEAIGRTYQELGDWGRAADWYGRALALAQPRGELTAEARLHGRLGTVHTFAAAWGPALREWRAAAVVHRRLEDPAGQARALSETARVQEYAGHPHESVRTCKEALEAARRAGDTRLRAVVQHRLADALDRLGDPVAAEVQRSAAQRLLEELAEEQAVPLSANGST